jgi:hypothetical protein
MDDKKQQLEDLFNKILLEQLEEVHQLIIEEGDDEALNKIKELIDLIKTV